MLRAMSLLDDGSTVSLCCLPLMRRYARAMLLYDDTIHA